MADKIAVRGVAGRGRFTKVHSSIQNESSNIKNIKEEKLLKEKLLDEKMKLIRQKNEETLRRKREIEDDIKNASLHSCQVAEEKPALADYKMAGVQKDNSSAPKVRGRARGRVLAKMAKEELQAHRFEKQRKKNYEIMEKEHQEEKSRGSPPQGGSSSFLYNDHRVDMSKVTSRSIHSWGGSQFEDVVEKVNKEVHSRPRKENVNIELTMTGKDRKEYVKWKEERLKIDSKRKMRQKSGDTWQREWDQSKTHREADSTQEINDQQDSRRSGQRFGERRQKPDWDLHDDRFAETEQDSQYTSNGNKNEGDDWEESIVINDQSEGWKDSSSRGHKNKIEYYSIVTVEDINTISIQDDPYTSEETSIAVDNATINSEKQNVDNIENKTDSTKIGEMCQAIIEPRKRNITDEPINNNMNMCPDETKVTVCNDQDNCEETTKEDDAIEQPKPQRVHRKQTHREKKETQSGKLKEKEDLTKEKVKTEETNSSLKQNQVDMTDDQIKLDSTNNMSELHHVKAKNNLPKLEIKKIEDSIEFEAVPDFLKTPQKKNWADCEFDEDLMDLPPLEWDSLTKKYIQ